MASLTSQGYGDFILLGGFKSPGLCDVSGADMKHRWQKNEGFGLSGASTVYQGTELAEFSVKFRLYGDPQTPDPDWAEWNKFADNALAKPPRGARPSALDIWHPVLERQKIKSVGVREVGQPYQSDDGEWTIEVKFIQYQKPKITLAKPEGSKANPAPTDWGDKVIADLHSKAQLEELAGPPQYKDVPH